MPTRFARLTTPLRDADWLTDARARAYCMILAAVTLLVAAAWVALSRNGLDLTGKPLGTDFLSFWTASRLALAGTPDQAYDIARHQAAQRAVFPAADIGYAAFFYPPVYLLVCLPLAMLPYLASLVAWLTVTGAAYWAVVRAFLADAVGVSPAIFAFPAVLINCAHGQNGFLTAALFGGGVLASARRPVLAGVLFGCLAIKPHLAILIPVALLARGAWRTLFAAGATTLVLVGVSVAAFGTATWQGFAADSSLARQSLEQGLVGPEKMQSAFAAFRLLGGSVATAYALQVLVAAAAAALLVSLARSRAESSAQGAALVAASLLATPFLLDYDLVLLAIPLAWLIGRALQTGFLPWEKTLLLVGFLLPLVSRLVAQRLGIPLGPPVLAAVFLLVVRRALADVHGQESVRRLHPGQTHIAGGGTLGAAPASLALRRAPAE